MYNEKVLAITDEIIIRYLTYILYVFERGECVSAAQCVNPSLADVYPFRGESAIDEGLLKNIIVALPE